MDTDTPALDGSLGLGLRIFLFGPPEVRWNGQPLALPRRQTRALLFRLAAADGPLGRDALAELLWPESDGPSNRRALTRLLTHLRAAVPDPAAILATADHVALRPDRC